MKAMDIKTTPLEVDRKCWVFSDGNSIPFREIESEIQDRLNLIKINVYGEYIPENLSIEPMVYIQAGYEGYHYRQQLDKSVFCGKGIESYYDWLAKMIAQQFARRLFLKEDNNV